jgi:DNA-binding XRE family transcriptional regulator
MEGGKMTEPGPSHGWPMNDVTTFKTPGGEEMVILPAAKYAQLVEAVEMAEDVAALDEFARKLAAGEEELIPSEMVDRILDGENPIRVWREHRGLTIKDLAEAAGIAAPYLSQVETGKREGSIETLKKIASALKLTIDDLV